jgi:hypothetical protein
VKIYCAFCICSSEETFLVLPVFHQLQPPFLYYREKRQNIFCVYELSSLPFSHLELTSTKHLVPDVCFTLK